jgi:hypothetical protein
VDNDGVAVIDQLYGIRRPHGTPHVFGGATTCTPLTDVIDTELSIGKPYSLMAALSTVDSAPDGKNRGGSFRKIRFDNSAMGPIRIAYTAGFGPSGFGRAQENNFAIVRQQQVVHEDIVIAGT